MRESQPSPNPSGPSASSSPSARTRVLRRPQRAAYDLASVAAIVDAGLLCTVAFQWEGSVHAIPTLHWREGDHLYLHAAKASRLGQALLAGEACVSIALADGLVLARSAMHHSLNYRSVVIYGRFEAVTEPEEKHRALRACIEGLYPGRWEELRPMTAKEVNATAVLRLSLAEASAKVRQGGPKDDAEDLAWPAWAGVIPLQRRQGEPEMEADSPLTEAPPTRFGRPGQDGAGVAGVE